ncbi:MAG: radical SAM protein [Deltaproteobacteria bacterium]|nr:radical SAM protein [Deltaproteobacteria bacterium]
MSLFQPGYIKLHHSGLLAERIQEARLILSSCRLCPRACGVDRSMGQTGVCRTDRLAMVSSYGPHFGEEDPLVGRNGSGTIFFTNCNLLCLFCQNYDISHDGDGRQASSEDLAALMLDLAQRGCHNINFVTPTHVVPQILEALPLAIENGLNVPLVYNCGGYEAVETIKLLEGVFAIYMPDFKFWDDEAGRKYCGVTDYSARARAALVEMHRQVGDLRINPDGVAERGLLVRHLVMPDDLAGAAEISRFLALEISPSTYFNVMGQYRPCGRAHEFPELGRSLTRGELAEAKKQAKAAGLTNLDERRRTPFNWI